MKKRVNQNVLGIDLRPLKCDWPIFIFTVYDSIPDSPCVSDMRAM